MNDGLKMKEQLIQEGASAEERKRMSGNYEHEGPPLKKALIVDDVLTTGSSLYGAFLAMKPHVRKVRLMVLARAHNFTLVDSYVL